jgi:hypothetical protein
MCYRTDCCGNYIGALLAWLLSDPNGGFGSCPDMVRASVGLCDILRIMCLLSRYHRRYHGLDTTSEDPVDVFTMSGHDSEIL